MIHQVRNSHKGGGPCIFIHESLCYKLRKNLSINPEAIESLSIEISDKTFSNLIFNAIYRPPTGDKNIWTILQGYIFKKLKYETHDVCKRF